MQIGAENPFSMIYIGCFTRIIKIIHKHYHTVIACLYGGALCAAQIQTLMFAAGLAVKYAFQTELA